MAYSERESKKLLKKNPGADKDLIKLFNAGVFKGGSFNPKTPAPTSNLSNSEGTFGDGIMYRNEEQMTAGGVYGQGAADDLYQRDRGGFVNPRLDKAQATGLVSEFGLDGTGLEKELVGLTRSQAESRAKQLKNERMAQTSANTSFQFDPKSISGFRDIFKDIKLRLDENKNEPWTDNKTKKQTGESILKSYTNQLAGLFQSPEQFQAAQQDKEFQRTLRQYERAGGSVNDIAANIGNGQVSVTNEVQNPDGTSTVTYSDGQTRDVTYQTNADGSVTPVFQNEGNQTIDQYLGAMNTKSEQMAIQSLIPEKKIAQDQIAFEQSIPEAYREYYFGSEEQIGVLQRRQAEMEEGIKLLERESKIEQATARAQAASLEKRSEFEQQKSEAQIEENRLVAKNYLTGQLAKLGALNTTGKAPEAIANLEFKYQKQAQDLKTEYQFDRQDLKIKLRDQLDTIELDRDNEIFKLKTDLSKDEDSAWKEIFKLQTEAQRKEFSLIDNFARDFRSRNDKYTAELKKEAEKYAKDLEKAASTFDLSMFREGDFVSKKDKKGKRVDGGILSPTGELRDINEILESSKGSDGYVNSDTYKQMFERYTASGGTRSKFLSLYPPAKYVNPQDNSLPSFLKFGTSVRSEADTEKDERDDF